MSRHRFVGWGWDVYPGDTADLKGNESIITCWEHGGSTEGRGDRAVHDTRTHHIHRQAVEIDKAARRSLNAHGSAVVWLTGLSGAGKSTLANQLETRLHALGIRTYLLDGDHVRLGLNKDLGFTAANRVENIRRVAEVSKLMVDAGLLVITAFISPFPAQRRMARELLDAGEFVEVYVNTSLAVAEERDPKGLYEKARRGEIKEFTGVDSPYEAPEGAELVIDTTELGAHDAADRICARLAAMGLLTRG